MFIDLDLLQKIFFLVLKFSAGIILGWVVIVMNTSGGINQR